MSCDFCSIVKIIGLFVLSSMSVCLYILPLHFQQFVEAAEVELLQLLGMLLVDCLSFRSVRRSGRTTALDFQLGGQADLFLFPH